MIAQFSHSPVGEALIIIYISFFPRTQCRRFMDDWLIFADSRKSLRLIRLTAQRVLRKLGLFEHPDKTFLGCGENTLSFHRVMDF
jgi:hypothetical protein